jgi:uncharacterized protein with GYD domain
MIFISLNKLRGKATKEDVEKSNKILASEPKVKVLAFYWTLGRYDTVLILKAPNEKVVMKLLLQAGEWISTETMVAVPREEAIKLL